MSRRGDIVGDRLQKGEKLEVGQSLTSANGAYKAILQDDGNFVLYAGDQSVWSTETNGQSVVRAEVQEDGNFVLYTADKPVWHSDTKGAKDVRLVLQDDRNLVLYGFDGPAWSSETHTDDAPPPPPPPPPPAVQTYTVVSGDTLWAISERFYGDGNRYQEIANASSISNPDLIHPGQVLTIP
jgi:hypothetical protein